jgi:selenocysteine lyase/cysteine desulfurase
VHVLTAWLLRSLLALRHDSGRSLVRIYGPQTAERRGGTIAFNFYDRAGGPIDHRAVEASAAARGISLRTGCFCNPGAGELALGLNRSQMDSCFAGQDDHMTYDDLRRCIDPAAPGAVRVSLGLASNFHDVYVMVDWARSFLDR